MQGACADPTKEAIGYTDPSTCQRRQRLDFRHWAGNRTGKQSHFDAELRQSIDLLPGRVANAVSSNFVGKAVKHTHRELQRRRNFSFPELQALSHVPQTRTAPIRDGKDDLRS